MGIYFVVGVRCFLCVYCVGCVFMVLVIVMGVVSGTLLAGLCCDCVFASVCLWLLVDYCWLLIVWLNMICLVCLFVCWLLLWVIVGLVLLLEFWLLFGLVSTFGVAAGRCLFLLFGDLAAFCPLGLGALLGASVVYVWCLLFWCVCLIVLLALVLCVLVLLFLVICLL